MAQGVTSVVRAMILGGDVWAWMTLGKRWRALLF